MSDRCVVGNSIELKSHQQVPFTKSAVPVLQVGLLDEQSIGVINPFDVAFASGCKQKLSKTSTVTTENNRDGPGIQKTSPAARLANRRVQNPSQGLRVEMEDITLLESNVIEIDIFFKTSVVVRLHIDNGQLSNCSCQDLMALILEEPEVGIPKDADKVFALWLISPLFEVQLKPDHKPLQIWRKWPELLMKYTTVSEEKREKDQPYLSFQRDVFCPQKEEIRLATLTVLELLYEEAKENVLQGRYPCDQVIIERLAGMQARIELGKFDQDIHTMSYFRSRLRSFVPAYACRSRHSSIFSFGSKARLEYRIWLQFRAASDDLSAHNVMRQYLDVCHTLPFYGGAFFIAQIEKPASGLSAFIGNSDLSVVVSVNADGVTIISPTEGQVLLRLKYKELSWDSARPAHENNPDCLPCLFLQFQSFEGSGRVFKVLQVFSKQAILMDAIISSFVRALRQGYWDRDEIDDNSASAAPDECITPDGEDAHTPLTDNSIYSSNSNNSELACVNSKLQRLSLATFNEDGDCINLMGSWAFL